MSDFILNIARRSAGLGPGVLVEPAPGPMFLPTVSNAKMGNPDPDAEDQSEVEVPVPPFGNESHSQPEANKPGLTIGDTRLTARGREGATDRVTSDSSVVGNISFNSSISARQFDTQPSNIQSIIEPQSSSDFRYLNDTKSNLGKLPIDGPQPARDLFSAGLTPRLSETPGKKEPPGAARQSDEITQKPEAVATSMIEPATTEANSSNSLSENQQPGAVTHSEPQPIQVRIGTIEVRAEQVPPPRAAMSALPALQSGFDDYKSIR
jgi:hypothetical protein